jgi:hypothetical protein
VGSELLPSTSNEDDGTDVQKPTADTDVLKEVTALAVMMGEPNDEAVTYTKSASVQVSRDE